MTSPGFIVKDQDGEIIREDMVVEVIDMSKNCSCFELNFHTKARKEFLRLNVSGCSSCNVYCKF